MSNAEEWTNTSDAAARLGISERAIQRRCKSGKLRARLVPTATGQAWEIHTAALDVLQKSGDSNDTPDSDTNDGNDTPDRPNDDDTTATTIPTTPTTVTTPSADSDDSHEAAKDEQEVRVSVAETETRMLREALENERENVAFLRTLIEQRDRDAAELRAALRKALEAMPKQLGGAPSQQDIPESEANTPQNPKSEAVKQVSTSANPAQRAQRREARPLWKVVLGIR